MSDVVRTDDLPPLPARPCDGHKGTFGHVLVLAGSALYPGAAILATHAAARGGAGLVTLAYPRAMAPHVAAHLVCELARPLDDHDGALGTAAVEPALALAAERSAVALGPGLTRGVQAEAFARELALRVTAPSVIDADALNAFEGRAADLAGAAGPRVLTPHPGEAARLVGAAGSVAAEGRVHAALALAAATGAVVALKGHGTVVTDGRRVRVNTTGNPGMATGGTGDVLTGLVAALLAQGMEPFDAAVLGVHLHGLAGDLAAQRLGRHALVATDLLDALPEAFRRHV